MFKYLRGAFQKLDLKWEAGSLCPDQWSSWAYIWSRIELGQWQKATFPQASREGKGLGAVSSGLLQVGAGLLVPSAPLVVAPHLPAQQDLEQGRWWASEGKQKRWYTSYPKSSPWWQTAGEGCGGVSAWSLNNLPPGSGNLHDWQESPESSHGSHTRKSSVITSSGGVPTRNADWKTAYILQRTHGDKCTGPVCGTEHFCHHLAGNAPWMYHVWVCDFCLVNG